MVADAAEHVGQPGFGIDVVELGGGDQGVHSGGALTTPIGAAEGPIFSSDSDTAQSSFGGIIGQAYLGGLHETPNIMR